MVRWSKGLPSSKPMAVPPVVAGFSPVLCRKRERTWHVGVNLTIMSAWDGALPGLPTATFFIIVLPPILKVSHGQSARNTSGGTPNTIMGMEQRVVGLATMFQTSQKRSHQLPKLTQMVQDWMPMPARIHS